MSHMATGRNFLIVTIAASNLLLVSQAMPQPPTPPANSSIVYFVRAADTENADLKDGINQSLIDLDNLILQMRNSANITVKPIDIKDDHFSCSQIRKEIDAISTLEDDVVVFYYLGHGVGIDASHKFPQFDCIRFHVAPGIAADDQHSSASLDGVISQIQSKAHKPRLVIAVADTCNVPFPSTAQTLQNAAAIDYLNGLPHLFYDYRGTLQMSGAIYPEAAHYWTTGPSRGGLFTKQLLSDISSEIQTKGGTAKWANIAMAAQDSIPLPDSATDTGFCFPPGHPDQQYKCQHPLANDETVEIFPKWPH